MNYTVVINDYVTVAKSSTILLNFLCSNRKWRVYFTDWTNWLDILSVAATLLIIPFRIANLEVQWVFVAVAYVLHSLRLFEYAIIMS